MRGSRHAREPRLAHSRLTAPARAALPLRAMAKRTRTRPRALLNRELRAHLLRLDRIDSTLRSAWVETEFRDRALERKLDALTTAGIGWLREVLAEHGWPGRTLVGRSAADAACRLVQHAECSLAFQRRCLRLIRDAAARGEVPLQQVAYLTDVVRMRAGKKQLYGAKSSSSPSCSTSASGPASGGCSGGRVSFDWKETGQRLTYTWSPRELRVGMAPLPG